MPMSFCRRRGSSGRCFRIIGGARQFVAVAFADLKILLALDETRWALTSVSVAALRVADQQFVEMLDADNNGTIRTDEVKVAIKLLLTALRDGGGYDRGAAELELAALNPETAEGLAALKAAKQILANLGHTDSGTISIDEICSERAITLCTHCNGDGVVTPSPEIDPELAHLIDLIVATTGGVADRSGRIGAGQGEIAKFKTAATAYLNWLDEPEKKPEALRPFGDRTGDYHAIFDRVRQTFDDYFLGCETLRFLNADAERTAAKNFSADILVPEAVRKLLSELGVAAPRRDGVLDFGGPLNPVLKPALDAFCQAPETAEFLTGERELAAADWQRLKAVFAPYESWCNRKPGENFNAVDSAVLRTALNGSKLPQLEELSAADLAAADVLAGGGLLLKLALYQRYLREFLNNFVNLGALFNPAAPSLLQMGSLVLDSRRYTLTAPVTNLAEHKRIAAMSDICVLYVEITGANAAGSYRKTVAAAVTAGSMRNLFVGKHGVFFAAGGEVCDARVVDFVEQPVSLLEALKSPFYRFGGFVGQQADKFFSAKTAAAQNDLGKQLNSNFSAVSSQETTVPKPTPAVSGSMVLMGGGIGIAAIGSSVAFIAKSLQNISILNVLAVLFGIIVIFGGPMVAISLVKLYRRDLARFLEAGGGAVNFRMRLSGKLGRLFTYRPGLPNMNIKDTCRTEDALIRRRRKILLAALLLAVLLGIAAGVWLGAKLNAPRLAQPHNTAAQTAIRQKLEKQPENAVKSSPDLTSPPVKTSDAAKKPVLPVN